MTPMQPLPLHAFHTAQGARFGTLEEVEVVLDYGDSAAEHAALQQSVALIDLSFRGRLCLTGSAWVRFPQGQVPNDIKRLQTGGGCYAALVTAKGRMESDLNVYALFEELLLDFEPGLTAS